MALLTLRNIETYYGPILAIRGVSLEVPEGAVVAILGANGAGKTTVLKTIGGAMDPQKGSVAFDGQDITSRDPDRIARLGIGHVPEGREVFPFLNVEENLGVGAFTRRRARTWARIWRWSTATFPPWPSTADSRPDFSPAASNRCWPSAAP